MIQQVVSKIWVFKMRSTILEHPVVWSSFTVRDTLTDSLLVSRLATIMTDWPIWIFHIYQVCVIFLFVLFISLCLSLQVSCVTSTLRGDLKSPLGHFLKPATISKWAFFYVIILYFVNQKIKINLAQSKSVKLLLLIVMNIFVCGACFEHITKLLKNWPPNFGI